MCSAVLSHVRLFATLWAVGHQAHLSMDSLGKNTRVGCHAQLQSVFPTQGLNLGLLHCRQILYHWAIREAPIPAPVSAVAQSCPTLGDSMDCSTPGFPVHHQLLQLAQNHIHWVSNAIQLSHPLSSLSSLALNLTHHQSLFQWISSSVQVAKVLEFQLQHQSFQWIFRTDFL